VPKHFDATVLNQLSTAEEIPLETRSSTGRTHRTIVWVVVEGQEVYVRCVRGSYGRWDQESTANAHGAIEVNGQHLAGQAVPVTDEASISRGSSADLRKYRSSPVVRSIVRQETLPTTLRLDPAELGALQMEPPPGQASLTQRMPC
jgi:hypothetical protein